MQAHLHEQLHLGIESLATRLIPNKCGRQVDSSLGAKSLRACLGNIGATRNTGYSPQSKGKFVGKSSRYVLSCYLGSGVVAS